LVQVSEEKRECGQSSCR